MQEIKITWSLLKEKLLWAVIKIPLENINSFPITKIKFKLLLSIAGYRNFLTS